MSKCEETGKDVEITKVLKIGRNMASGSSNYR
jgi:hypothetical protein